MKKLQYKVKNSLGIHARPAALLAQACTNFKSAVMIECNGNVASGNNVLQILALHAAKGSILNITADGPDEEETIRKIEEVLANFSEINSEYQIRISHLDGKDSMRIYVEASGSCDFKALQQKIASAVKSRIGFTPIVYVVELGFLPRSEKKSKRVIDERFQ